MAVDDRSRFCVLSTDNNLMTDEFSRTTNSLCIMYGANSPLILGLLLLFAVEDLEFDGAMLPL